MSEIQLIEPASEHESAALDYIREFQSAGEFIHGSAGLEAAQNYSEWLAGLARNSHSETVREGFVPASTYFGVRASDGRIVGIIDIRHRLNDYLLQCGGHIGYSVRKSERRKGYAGQMLRLALARCSEMGLVKVLVTCDKDNIASARTIQSCGGVLENEVPQEGAITQRYWIALK